jgi:urease accessory protein
MAPDISELLTALQFADSAFPSGGFAFSWGLEGLAADGLVENPQDVAEIAEEQLTYRWNSMDRILLRDAYVATDVVAITAVDLQAEASTLSRQVRVGSRRAGRALLGTFVRLGHSAARDYRKAIQADVRLGHLAVVQGVVFKAAGLTLPMAELLSGWSVVSGLASAAIRLGLIGHVEAQEVATSLRPLLARLLARNPPVWARLASFTPLTDIATSRAASRHIRMFAT